MAGIGNELVQPLQVNPTALLSQAIEQRQPIVTPDAVAKFSEAFRNGQISADDVISRYGELAKTKEKAEIQGLHEYMSPESIQARRDVVNAQGGQAKLLGARANAGLGLLPQETATDKALLDAKFYDATLHPGDYDKKRDAILAVGGMIPDIEPGQPLSSDQKTEIDDAFNKAVSYRQHVGMATSFLGQIESKDATTKTIDSSGRKKEVTAPGALHIHKSFGVVDDKTRARVAALAFTPFSEWQKAPTTFTEAITGKALKPGQATGGGTVEPKVAPAPTEKPTVSVEPADSTSALENAPGAYVSDTTEPNELDLIEKIQKTYQNKPQVVQWGQSQGAYQKLASAMDHVSKLTDEQQRNMGSRLAEDDIELASNFIKLYDPQAVIREFKWEKLENKQALVDKLKNLAATAFAGATFTPETRREIARAAGASFKAQQESAMPALKKALDQETRSGVQALDENERATASGQFVDPMRWEKGGLGTATPAGNAAPVITNVPGLGRGYMDPVTHRFHLVVTPPQ